MDAIERVHQAVLDLELWLDLNHNLAEFCRRKDVDFQECILLLDAATELV